MPFEIFTAGLKLPPAVPQRTAWLKFDSFHLHFETNRKKHVGIPTGSCLINTSFTLREFTPIMVPESSSKVNGMSSSYYYKITVTLLMCFFLVFVVIVYGCKIQTSIEHKKRNWTILLCEKIHAEMLLYSVSV